MDSSHQSYGPSQPVPSTRPSPAAVDFHPSLSGLRVLVVDDEAHARQAIADVLSVYGAGVTQATDTKDALEILAREDFDILVSDIGMDGPDGFDLIREIRSRGIQTPAIALSGYTGIEPQQKALAAGFQSHLDKPVETLYLVAAVADIAETKKPSE